jgi:DNA-binding GntR family transcriptional regulator
MKLTVNKIDRHTLNERVYDELRRAIMAGRFPPGSTVTLRSLAQMMGTSEMPVRDAVRRLVVERALVALPNRSVIVPVLSEAAFREICEVRQALEPLATRAAVENLTNDDIAALRASIRNMAAARSHSKYLEANQEFHFRIYAAAQRPMLYSMIESLWMQTGPLMNLVELTAGMTEAASHHSDVVDALMKADGSRAAKAIAQDIDGAATFILGWMRSRAPRERKSRKAE